MASMEVFMYTMEIEETKSEKNRAAEKLEVYRTKDLPLGDITSE